MKPVKHLFWDFDGTLYDSYPQISGAVMKALDALGFAGRIGQEELMVQLKRSVTHAVRWSAGVVGLDEKTVYERYHAFHTQEKTFPPYEGLEDCIRQLHAAGYRHYLYTHRDRLAIEQLERDGLWALFEDAVTSADGFPGKPAPDALLALAARNGLNVEECAMIGDRSIDIEAGHNAGMSGFLFDPDGYFESCQAELRVKSMKELQKALTGR